MIGWAVVVVSLSSVGRLPSHAAAMSVAIRIHRIGFLRVIGLLLSRRDVVEWRVARGCPANAGPRPRGASVPVAFTSRAVPPAARALSVVDFRHQLPERNHSAPRRKKTRDFSVRQFRPTAVNRTGGSQLPGRESRGFHFSERMSFILDKPRA